MDQKKFNNSTPRVKIIQKIYNSLMNPDTEIEYPKNQYKKFIKDVVTGTLERSELLEETINSHLREDINLKKTDKLLKIILFAALFELMFKHNTPKKVIISEYLIASEHFLEKIQIGYLNAILDKIAKILRKDE
mgnify:CR=1 FL=1